MKRHEMNPGDIMYVGCFNGILRTYRVYTVKIMEIDSEGPEILCEITGSTDGEYIGDVRGFMYYELMKTVSEARKYIIKTIDKAMQRLNTKIIGLKQEQHDFHIIRTAIERGSMNEKPMLRSV